MIHLYKVSYVLYYNNQNFNYQLLTIFINIEYIFEI